MTSLFCFSTSTACTHRLSRSLTSALPQFSDCHQKHRKGQRFVCFHLWLKLHCLNFSVFSVNQLFKKLFFFTVYWCVFFPPLTLKKSDSCLEMHYRKFWFGTSWIFYVCHLPFSNMLLESWYPHETRFSMRLYWPFSAPGPPSNFWAPWPISS